MWTLLKAVCLAVYALALAGLFGWLPDAWSSALQAVAALFLLAHVIELLFAFRHVRRYKGGLIASIGLTLLFGLLHWMPLADAHKRELAQAAG